MSESKPTTTASASSSSRAAPAAEWQLACQVSAIPEKKGLKAKIQGRDVALFRDGEQVFALDARCYHAGKHAEEHRVCMRVSVWM